MKPLAPLCSTLLFAVTAFTAMIGKPSLATANEPIRVMSFNIRYGTANDGINRWENRREFLIETVKRFNPDLLGTQETLAFQRDYLLEQLSGFETVAAGRDDGKEAGEMAALFYRKDRFEPIDSGHFWLSSAPDQVGRNRA